MGGSEKKTAWNCLLEKGSCCIHLDKLLLRNCKNCLKSLVNNNLTNEYKNVQFKGLMGMASFSNDTDLIKRQFKKLKQLFEDSKEKINDFRILSMGMSNDYKIALEEGSNMIRIGSKIFGERNYL